MNILGISAFYHDSAAAIIKDGEIIAAAQEERFTRKKHDSDFPIKAIEFCLKQAGITSQQIDYVAYYEKPFTKFERLLNSYLATAPKGFSSFAQAMPIWMKQKLWIKSLICEKLGYDNPIVFPTHHQSHAAAAFFSSPFQQSAFLTLDGVGEWATTSFGTGKDNQIQIHAEILFPHSLGFLYSAFTYYTGFKVNSGEYKVMGLAPYGEPKYRDKILNELIDLKEDGSFHLNLKYFDYVSGLRMTNEKFDDLFGGPPRSPESNLTQREMDLAASIQVVTEEVMLKIVRHVHKVTQQDSLCLAGGVALNCVGNGRILREGPFKKIWIQPAAGDAGSALGAALFVWYQHLKKERQADGVHDSLRGSYLGPNFDDRSIQEFLDCKNITYHALEEDELIDQVAGLIADEKVIGWFQGNMEFGPRALGNRSIIGDARSSKMQEIMNLKIKFRESFRPFAPSVLRESVSEFFELNGDSPYMLLVAPVQEQIRRQMSDAEMQLFGIQKLNVSRSNIPAVTHVDYSARIQTVTPESNPKYFKLIEKFKNKTGFPLIINTSFNVRGEPIVCTPEEAYLCFMRTGMDVLVLGNYVLYKTEQKPLEHDTNWQKEFVLD